MKHIPLAHRMRPETIDEVIGQDHLVGINKPIRKMIESNQIRSLILSGPPGTGKTTLSEIIANSAGLPYRKLNAASARKADIDKVIKEAEENLESIILFVDEVHRFTKTQVETLLGPTEGGDLVLIGSTTESPYHAVPPAILSRSTVFETKNLSIENIVTGLRRAVEDKDKGLGDYDIEVSDQTLTFIAESTGGDLRASLNVLENAVITNEQDGKVEVTNEMIEGLTGNIFINTDGESNTYNLLSAFHKSVRGSDVDAAIYYLAQLLQVGAMEEVIRRLRIIPMEDCFTNLNLGTHVYAATKMAQEVGMPEARIILSAVTIECCLTPKSNAAYQAINQAMQDIRSGKTYPVPEHLKDGHYKNAPKGTRNYVLPHNAIKDPNIGGWSEQDYLPKEMLGTRYYHPTELGHERNLKRMYEHINNLKGNN